MALIGQEFNATAARYLRKTDGKAASSDKSKVTPQRNYRPDGSWDHPYEGEWKETLQRNLKRHFKMKNGCLVLYKSAGLSLSIDN